MTAVCVVFGLLALGFIVGLILLIVGSRDRELNVLARRLEAEQRVDRATHATLRAMRDAVRPRNDRL